MGCVCGLSPTVLKRRMSWEPWEGAALAFNTYRLERDGIRVGGLLLARVSGRVHAWVGGKTTRCGSSIGCCAAGEGRSKTGEERGVGKEWNEWCHWAG